MAKITSRQQTCGGEKLSKIQAGCSFGEVQTGESFHLNQCQDSQFGGVNWVTTSDQEIKRCPDAQEECIVAHKFEPVAWAQVWKIDTVIEDYQSGSMADEAQPGECQSAAFPDQQILDRRRFAYRIDPFHLTKIQFHDLLGRDRRERYDRFIADRGVV